MSATQAPRNPHLTPDPPPAFGGEGIVNFSDLAEKK